MLCDNCFKEVKQQKLTKHKNQYLCETCLIKKLGYQQEKDTTFKNFIYNVKDKLFNRPFIK